ncbi:PH-like domain-containing protein [Microbacterium sp. A93]|uniref:PH-like domain-containing protein n=1 Tax=Microbacterium sp. A93 TaxID=3450716 RepID=UPI003F41BA0E
MNEDLSAEYTLIGILTGIGLVVFVALMWWGWRHRKRRQQDLAAPAAVPKSVLGSEPLAGAEGMYVATVRGQDYLDRVAVHGLGLRTNARLEVHDSGVALFREGSPNLFIPRADLREAGLASGMSGKFVEKDGLVAVTWMLGGQEVSTGFRTRTSPDRDPLLAALRELINPTTDPTTDPQMENNS